MKTEPVAWACDKCIWYLSSEGASHGGRGGQPDWHWESGRQQFGRCKGNQIALYTRESIEADMIERVRRMCYAGLEPGTDAYEAHSCPPCVVADALEGPKDG